MRVLWAARSSNQSLLKEINPQYSLEGLKLQYFGHLMPRGDSLEKTLMLEKIEGKRRRGQQIVKAMVFPVVIYRCESRTVKNAQSEELMPLN